MLRKDSHIVYYVSLIGLLIAGLILVISLYPNKNYQMITVVGMSIAYLIIGVIHHLKSHDLVGKIVIEYILIAAFGVAAAFFIFKGGFGI